MSRNVAIMGATGAVGTEFLELLAERNFQMDSLKLLASERSVGKKLKFAGEEIAVELLTDDAFEGVDLVLSSAGGGLSKQFAPAVRKAGAVMVDNTSAFRMDPDTPLVIPEVNPEAIKQHNGIIANPNCSTIIMNVPVFPLHKVNPIKRLVISTYQAASGAGAAAMEELKVGARAILDGQPFEPKVLPHPAAFNVFAHNSAIGDNGYNEEEMKMVNETRKIFSCESIMVAATCVRVPVMRAHAESINIEFTNPITEDEVRDILASAPGVKIVDDREGSYFPMPKDASGQDDILVGRIRQDISQPGGNGIELFVCGDQIRKGAALNAIQIAELL
ncbi:MAG: aspartate-semialdehyde dehydrogenase [Phycisphaerae bacterium]|nr:aspartate-semialdehyde dehydrogenase [Phycisphaerae bacterium]